MCQLPRAAYDIVQLQSPLVSVLKQSYLLACTQSCAGNGSRQGSAYVPGISASAPYCGVSVEPGVPQEPQEKAD